MQKIKILAAFCGLLTIMNRCADKIVSPDEINAMRELSTVEKKLTDSDNRFGLKVFRQIVKEQPDQNIFISPLSVTMALGMTFNGAAGETQTAMRNTLEYGDLSIDEINQSYAGLIDLLTSADSKVNFQIANSIWYRNTFSVIADFINVNTKYFDAKVSALDFDRSDAADIINSWVNEKTNGKIKEIVPKPISSEMVMYLINAIYFKGSWTYEFNKDHTTDEPFYLSSGNSTTCKMMSHKSDHPYFQNEQVQAIDLAYGNAGFSMTIFLPAYGSNVNTLIESLDNDSWNEWLSQLDTAEVSLFMPKFKLSYQLKMIDVLSTLGMEIAFVPGQADFTKINANGDLYISEVMHKTFVDVNEEGTEAAAVTAVGVGATSVGPESPVMRIDRPFIFAIRERQSGTILFIGKIMEPVIE
ncbi:MAG: serpin family protein [Candidatus Neomarinimicrobiota bacterium]